MASIAKDDYDSAVTDCNKAIQLDPTKDMAYYCRGTAYVFEKDKTRAIGDLKEFVEMSSNARLIELAEQALSQLEVLEE